MNQKTLVGSIIAVAILIGVSFTSVVGFQSVKSNVKASPLFTVRTKRAIDEESEDLTCDYIWRGKESRISPPTRYENITTIQKVLDRVNSMNDRTFNKFTRLLVWQANNNNNKMKDINNNAIIDALHHIRDNPGLLKNQIIEQYNHKPLVSKQPEFTCCRTCDSSSECKWVWLVIALLILFIICIGNFMDWLSELTSKAWCS